MEKVERAATRRLLRDRHLASHRRQTRSHAVDLHAYLAARLLSELAAFALSTALGWTLYEISHRPITLGLVGIFQFVPALLLTLPAGEICDRVSPRRVLLVGYMLQCVCVIALVVAETSAPRTQWPLFVSSLAFAAARAFTDPAGQALLPLIAPKQHLPRAIAWTSSATQIAVIAGPALGGLAYSVGPACAFAVCAVSFAGAVFAMVLLKDRKATETPKVSVRVRIAHVFEGVNFVRSQPAVLGALSLDLAVVLLGGATALLPVYARDILHVGPIGLGLLRSLPAAGACLLALAQARYPLIRKAGLWLFTSVAVFGGATLVFAFSRVLAVSAMALLLIGASDMISVNIRTSLVQLATPPGMQGRVAAVNMLFIGASAELGDFESGLAASVFGAVPAVALGGAAALLVAAAWMRLFPALRSLDRLIVGES